VAVLVAVAALLGLGRAALRAATEPSLAWARGRFVRFDGVAVDDARRTEFGWAAVVQVDELVIESVPRSAEARVWVDGSGPVPGLEAGVPLSGSGLLEPIGAGGFADYLRARGVTAVLSVDDVAVRGPPTNPLLRLANAARGALRRGARTILPAREAGLLLGLAIGDTSAMDPEVDEDFRATGLGHLLAVSGSNVAMFLAPVIALVRLLRVGRAGRLVIGAAAVGFFALLTRLEPSVLRAGAMAGLALVGTWAGRPRSTAALLGAAVLSLLALDPALASALGFQLSVAATVGLALMAAPLAVRLRWMPRPLALAVAATLAAQLAVTPLLLLNFGLVPTVTVLANVLAFPAVPPALLLGLLAAGLAVLWPPLGDLPGELARLSLAYLAGVADRAARFSLPSLTAGDPVVPATVAALVGVAAWRLRRGRRPFGGAAAVLGLTLLAWSAIPRAGPPEELTAVFLDVGQGDAAVVTTPDGGTVLVDAGPDPDQVARELTTLGVRRIDLAVGTHAHADHVEGFPAVLSRFSVALLIEPGCPGDSPSYRRFMEAAAAEDVRVHHPRGGERLMVGRLVVEVLGPDHCYIDSPNDESIVVRLSYEGATILFAGDAEVPAQQDLIEDGDPLSADVLKVPHHGGDTSLPAFFEETGASLAVVSTGPNDYGHPVPSVLSTLRGLGMRVVRTDLAGDVTVRFTDAGLLLESASG
jgi:competence protein ComEC